MLTEVLIGLIVFLVCWNLLSRPKDFPPGPWGVPVLGHMVRFGLEPFKTAMGWTKTYGPIIGVNFGTYRSVILNDPKHIREAFGNPIFSDRPFIKTMADRSGGVAKGVLFTGGTEWMEQRRFALHNLRDLGFGKNSMEALVLDEVLELVKRIEKQIGKPIGLRNMFNAAVVNALWSIINGERFKQDDPELDKAISRITTNITESDFLTNAVVFIPWLAENFPRASGYSKLIKVFPEVLGWMQKNITKHNQTYEPGHPRDLIDKYLDESAKALDASSSFHPDRNTLLFTVMDLFVAGAETTSTTLTWMIAYLVTFADKQEKLWTEISAVIGSERVPSLSDRPHMPYTEAVINETLRYSSLTPFGLFHQNTEDVDFHGYKIPKGTMIVPNLYACNFGEAYWDSPQDFRPERFIGPDGKFKKNENLIPFSTGKRVCLGESLARDELFLFTTTLFQKFKISKGPVAPDLKPIVSSVLVPKPYEVVFEPRRAV